jgi:putative transposase
VLRPGDIVVLDNLGSHRARATRRAVLAAGARFAFLPPTRPTSTPIEQVFAKVKHWLRMAQARCIDAIHDHLARLVGGIDQSECANYFRNAGYISA